MTKTGDKPLILVVDDDKDTRDGLSRALGADYRVTLAADAAAALRALTANPSIDLMLSDVRMPGADGLQLLKAAKAAHPRLACILLTAYGTVDTAVAAMKDGADDFIMKPIDLDQLDERVARALANRPPEPAASLAPQQAAGRKPQAASPAPPQTAWNGLGQIVGDSDAMKKVFHIVRLAAPTEATVLLEGPSGTGKELVARAIHDLSPRAHGPFIAVHCAALTPTLLESELFGHEKGAFTGAVARQIGRFEAADHGTLFLDEISEVDPATQVKLLRVLEERAFERVGGAETLHTDIRVVAATNRDLKAYVDAGKFREDLYYRLNVVDIHLPPLRARTGDIPLLVDRFLKEFSAANGGRVTGIAPEAMRRLEAYDWPGNVRELRNTIEKMVVLAPGERLEASDVPDLTTAPATGRLLAGGTLEETEKAKILAVLAANDGNRTRAAAALGISRRTLHRKLDDYEAEKNQT